MSPIGIAIGIIVVEAQLAAGALIQAVLEGLAAGTFVYITFLEILPHELNSPGKQLLKVLFILLGFSIMASLTFLGWEQAIVQLAHLSGCDRDALCQLLQLPQVSGWLLYRKTNCPHQKRRSRFTDAMLHPTLEFYRQKKSDNISVFYCFHGLKHYVFIISFLEDFIQRGNTSCKLLQNNWENHRGKKCVITESLHLSLVFKPALDCKQSLTFDTIEETTGNKGLRYTCIIPCH